MKAKQFRQLILLLFSVIFFSCHVVQPEYKPQHDAYPAFMTEEEAALLTRKMTDCKIDSIEPTMIIDRQIWRVYASTKNNREIIFEYLVKSNSLWEVYPQEGPFDYELRPDMGLITLSKASEIALENIPGKIIYWKLRQEKSRKIWEYRFHIETGDRVWGIKIKAINGEIIWAG